MADRQGGLNVPSASGAPRAGSSRLRRQGAGSGSGADSKEAKPSSQLAPPGAGGSARSSASAGGGSKGTSRGSQRSSGGASKQSASASSDSTPGQGAEAAAGGDDGTSAVPAIGDRVMVTLPAGAGADLSPPAALTPSMSMKPTPSMPNGGMQTIGTVQHVGPLENAQGDWIGIHLDEPLGKNDGSVKGVRYFSCPSPHGVFCRPNRVHKLTEEQAKEQAKKLARTSSGKMRAERSDSDESEEHQDPSTVDIPKIEIRRSIRFADEAAEEAANAANKQKSRTTLKIPVDDEDSNKFIRRLSRRRQKRKSLFKQEGDSDSECSDAPIVIVNDDIIVHAGERLRSAEEEWAEAWETKVREMAYRGIQLGYILGIYQHLAEGTLCDSWGKTVMKHFDPDVHTTNDVVRQAIIPASKGTIYGNCAYSTVVQDDKPTLATVMVSHHWKNLFCHLVASMLAFALGDTSYEGAAEDLREKRFEDLRVRLDRRDALQMTFWGCLFCVNQHVSICGSFPPPPPESRPDYETAIVNYKRDTSDPLTGNAFQACTCGAKKHWNDSSECEMDKFDAMMAVLNHEAPKVAQRLHHVIVVDKRFEVFSRIWVMAEIAKGQELELTQTAMLYSGSTSLCADDVEHVRQTLDIRNCTASRKEDVDAILNGIPDIDKFNEQLKNVLFNSQSGLLETWSAERCAGFFDVIDPLKDLFGEMHWHAPQVITMGQESTGKSTLMERLTGIPVFPRDKDLCTRAVIKVRLRRGPQQDPRLLVEDMDTSREESSQRVKRENLGDAVLAEMTRQVRLEALRKEQQGQGSAKEDGTKAKEALGGPLEPSDGICTEKVIIVELTSPTSPNLDIADCPGLVAARSRGRPADVVTTTALLVRRYAEAHRDNALFLVTVKASDQPNNSLAMQLVQELGLEDRTLCVLTMTDVLTGDLTDRDCKLPKAFVKNHASRIWSLLCNEDDSGGSVQLGMGYILTALNDVSEEKGWSSYSRIDAMAQWEQLFFMELAKQWPEAEPHVDAALVKELSSCNSVWRHVKDAVDDFVRHHWLSDTFNLVQAEEQETTKKERELGLPRALTVEHRNRLLHTSNLLPGGLRSATQLDDLTDTMPIREAYVARATTAIEAAVTDMWSTSGMVKDLLAQLEAGIKQKLPESLVVGRSNILAGVESAFDIGAHLQVCLESVEQLFAEAFSEFQHKVVSTLETTMASDPSEAKLGRFIPVTTRLTAEIRRDLLENAGQSSSSAAVDLRSALGVASGCGFESSPWLKVDRAQGLNFNVKVMKDQIASRFALLFLNHLDKGTGRLKNLLRTVCLDLPDDIWCEDCSEQRFQLLDHLQKVRLSMARLKDAFEEDVRRLESEWHSAAANAEAAADAGAAGRGGRSKYAGRKLASRARPQPSAKVSSDGADGGPGASEEPGGDRAPGWRMRRNRTLARGAERGDGSASGAGGAAAWTRRSAEELDADVESWLGMVNPRAYDVFKTAGNIRPVLVEIGLGTAKEDDFLVGRSERCVRWRGSTSADGIQATLDMIRPGEEVAAPAFVNRLVAFLFAPDVVFESLGTSKEPLIMSCGDQLCVCLAHLRPTNAS
eukprot:TRINITY_DN51204_c0_g1_i1.p1 TRINITY_DN51204_c0_g1~~TRINITY_DN51204_c0_g1_i1.p1  ORF type:complete len:1580 (+),score=438.80 TRINITY_DN51204_c0_g1_i1:194-4933(+)